MTRRLIIYPGAQLDIEETVFYYENQKIGLGDQFLDELNQLLREITINPFRFPEVVHDTRRGLLNRFPYTVYFRTDNEIIAVIAILHQHRHPDTWKSR